MSLDVHCSHPLNNFNLISLVFIQSNLMNNRLSEIVKSILIKNEIDLFSLVVDG